MNKKALIEAALFMSTKPLSIKELTKIANSSEEEIKNILEELKKEFESPERGVHLIKMGNGYKLYVKPEYVRFVRHLTPYSDMKKGHLRVLALVAYKNGITQSEIVKVIGNRTYEYVRELIERGLIRAVKEGRTIKLLPTKEFANYFGLKTPEEAKKFFEGVINAKRNDKS
ncbi:MAG TPA: SMC-Scp complex subunit ScpB [Nanoarchaeota archaeon]|nr:SMC-Scp complex subunit ScpB [Nanoarchaeota archaeon]